MLYEWRTYRFGSGKATAYLEAFRDEGLALVTRHLPLLGYWLTESGRLNVLHHLWVYTDLADRAACRQSLSQDTDWTAGFGPRAFPMIDGQESAFLALATSSPLLDAALATARAVRHPSPGPIHAPSWAMLEIADVADTPGTPLARWRVVAGERPGTTFALSQWAAAPEPSVLTGDPLLRRELLRPCSFSPLR